MFISTGLFLPVVETESLLHAFYLELAAQFKMSVGGLCQAVASLLETLTGQSFYLLTISNFGCVRREQTWSGAAVF